MLQGGNDARRNGGATPRDCHLACILSGRRQRQACSQAGRQAVRQAAVEQCGNCKWNCLTGCHREWIMLPTRSAVVSSGRGQAATTTCHHENALSFLHSETNTRRTRECLTILMSIKRLIYMHHHQQQRKVPISAPRSRSLSLLIYLKSHSTL